MVAWVCVTAIPANIHNRDRANYKLLAYTNEDFQESTVSLSLMVYKSTTD